MQGFNPYARALHPIRSGALFEPSDIPDRIHEQDAQHDLLGQMYLSVSTIHPTVKNRGLSCRLHVNALDLTKWILEFLKKENEEWYRNWIIFDKAIKKRDTERELRR
jgi:hypothetical protein